MYLWSIITYILTLKSDFIESISPINMEPTQQTDEEIISRIVSNQETHLFEILYERHSARVYNKCLSFVQENALAEDLTHDIFLKVYLKLKSFEGRSKFSTWVYSITYNYCVDTINSKKKSIQNLDEYQYEQTLSTEPDDEELFRIQHEALKQILNSISPDDKSILLMKYQDDFSLQDISDSLGIGLSAVKMRLARAKQKVVDMYKSQTSHETV